MPNGAVKGQHFSVHGSCFAAGVGTASAGSSTAGVVGREAQGRAQMSEPQAATTVRYRCAVRVSTPAPAWLGMAHGTFMRNYYA